jgi:hypothetical protein
MTLAILGATFLGAYVAVKLCVWEDSRKTSTVSDYDMDYDYDEFIDF